MEDQVEDVETATVMVVAMEGVGRGMVPPHLNGRHNSNSAISRLQGNHVTTSELMPLNRVCRVRFETSNINNLSLQNLVWQKRKDLTA